MLYKIVRKIRTFSLKESCRVHPFGWYFSMCAVLVAWANYAQYKRLIPMFPVYDTYRQQEGGRMVQAKQQELWEVERYNNMVNQMRTDLKS
ncbi:hypothetical protein AGDE_02252 [Angomonas deanei]|uniref:Uncharacterized protein n=1 Tax=Angomonas deanei TaxID=59799 RepID=S9VFX1_9TRYP|nr:hypothetical protein AGDE_03512 [Angomonas deanei]EPY41672.1 hypothetical protein AGDE_02252 [Angomonas deanei]CAD2214268.1 hypothetical protein, conserved [Angomonas deanei]|eukprot:EPY40416.1 hypothetical protein AGDE_03512 [Angomonas deanei]